MQLTTQQAVEAAKDPRQRDKLESTTDVDPNRDFLMCVTMDLKETLDRRDFLNPIGGPRGLGTISAGDVRSGFVRLAKELRPEFESKTCFKLVLSGEVIGSPPHRFINLWDIAAPNDVPAMMEILAMPADKSQTYGHLDYLVQEETQNISRVFPAGLAKVTPPADAKRLYYVILGHQPPTVELYRFRIFFAAYPTALPVDGATFKLITSSISVTGVLNRIVQFWSVEVDQNMTVNEVSERVQSAFAGLPWRDTDLFNAEAAILLRPTEWDVSVQQEGSTPPSQACEPQAAQ